MKRIVSLDFLRGFAILGMLAFHVMLHISYYFQTSNLGEIAGNIGILLIVAIPLLVSQFRSLFLMISMTLHTYTTYKSLRGGANPESVLKKQILGGILLYLIALLCEGVLANWGVLGRALDYWGRTFLPVTASSYIDPNIVWSKALLYEGTPFGHVMHFETLNSVALCTIILAFVLYGLSKQDKGLKDANKKKYLITLVIVWGLFVLLTPIMYSFADWAYGGDYNSVNQYQYEGIGGFFKGLFFAAIAGREQPLFPFMGSAAIGAIIGIELAQEKVAQKLPKTYSLVGLGLFLVAPIMGLIEGFPFELSPHAAWLQLILDGLELIIFMQVLKRVEFNPKINMPLFMKRTQSIRRWGIISLSIFVWQIFIEMPIRVIGYQLTRIDFLSRGTLMDFSAVIMTIVVCIAWDLVVRLWEKAHYKGSFEWLMSKIASLLTKGKKGLQEPVTRLDAKTVLFEPEAIMFVPLESKGE